jgi:hypothetical protein
MYLKTYVQTKSVKSTKEQKRKEKKRKEKKRKEKKRMSDQLRYFEHSDKQKMLSRKSKCNEALLWTKCKLLFIISLCC